MSISVCYILRDCEKHIIDSLGSVKDKVSEIICIIDTRSKDKTYQKIIKFAGLSKTPVIVYDFEWWSQNYSEARNYGISKCTQEWILTLDGDEVLETIGEVGDADYYEAKVINKIDGQDREHLSVRLFRNDKNIYYESATHETVEYCLNRINAKMGTMDLRIRHFGYENLTPDEWRKKIDGLKEIYEKQLISEPDNQRNYYNLCTHAWSVKDYQGCIDYGVLSLFKALIPPVKAQVCLLAYFSYKKLDKDKIAVNYLMMSDEICPSQSSKVKLLEYYKSISNKEKIINTLQELKQLTINGSRFPNDINIGTESVEQKLKEILK